MVGYPDERHMELPDGLPPRPPASEVRQRGRTTPEKARPSETTNRAADAPTAIRMPSGLPQLAHPLPAKPLVSMVPPSARVRHSQTPSRPLSTGSTATALVSNDDDNADLAVFSMPSDEAVAQTNAGADTLASSPKPETSEPEVVRMEVDEEVSKALEVRPTSNDT
jgi:hypothetical protein